MQNCNYKKWVTENLPPLVKHVFNSIDCATHTLQYQTLGVSCFISRQFSLQAYTSFFSEWVVKVGVQVVKS